MHLGQGETHSAVAWVTGAQGCGVGMKGQRFPSGRGRGGEEGGGKLEGGRGEDGSWSYRRRRKKMKHKSEKKRDTGRRWVRGARRRWNNAREKSSA